MFRDRKAVVLDIEGVLFAGKEALPGGREVVETLAARGIPHRYLTNNSRMTAAELESHMRSLGLPVGAGRIVSVLDRMDSRPRCRTVACLGFYSSASQAGGVS